ncbi:hypothetical protein QYM36_002774 [Artemia franciscana]|uniref:Uncharacterized protein n=1 Tax=Artemia franciscana TaxID=6661 RepID=A0AA88I8L9_ARTSF|nr:hypothetical protein QYM36_002774 [Artemia franciscana]
MAYIPTTSRSEALERVARFLANNVTSPEPGPSGRGDSSNVAGQTTPSCRWDSSSDSDVEVVAILRPKQERTPVLIDINSDEETPVSVPTSPVDPNPRKSKNGERLKRLMRQQLNGAGSSSSLTVGESSGSSRRRIQSSVSSDESSAKKFRKRSYRKADYDSSDSEFEPNRKMKSPRPLKISSRDEISRGSSSDEEKKKKKRRKRSRDERSDRKKSGKHKKHKRKKSKERDSKRKKSKSHRRCDDTSSSSSSRGSAKSSSSSLRSWHE